MMMRSHPSRFVPLLVLSAMALGCASSGDRIVLDDGFTSLELQQHRFLVKFEREGITLEAGKKNLLFHSARLAMDDGAIYFSVENLESASKVEREYINRTIEAGDLFTPDVAQSSSPGATTTDRYSTSISVKNVVTVAAIVTTFREKPSDRTVMEASKVFEQLTEAQRRNSDS